MKLTDKNDLIGCAVVAGVGILYLGLVGLSIAIPVMIVVGVLKLMGVL